MQNARYHERIFVIDHFLIQSSADSCSLPCPSARRIDVPQAMLDNSKGFKSNVMTADLLVNHMKLVHYQILR